MGDGTLPPEAFKQYMIQDYLYLVSADMAGELRTHAKVMWIQFARANSLAGYKAKNIDDIAGVSVIEL